MLKSQLKFYNRHWAWKNTVKYQNVNRKFGLEMMWLLEMLIASHLEDLEIDGIPKSNASSGGQVILICAWDGRGGRKRLEPTKFAVKRERSKHRSPFLRVLSNHWDQMYENI